MKLERDTRGGVRGASLNALGAALEAQSAYVYPWSACSAVGSSLGVVMVSVEAQDHPVR